MSQNNSKAQTKTSNSELPPLEVEDERVESFSEKKEVKFEKCNHKKVKYLNGKLVCRCGAVWTGTRLQEIFDHLTR